MVREQKPMSESKRKQLGAACLAEMADPLRVDDHALDVRACA